MRADAARRCARIVLLAAGMLAAAAADAGAGGGSSAQESGVRNPDFLFGRPAATLGLRALWRGPHPASDLFDFTGEFLTLERSDLAGLGLIVDVGFGLTSRLDAVVGVEYSRGSSPSEYRDFVGDDGQPIAQVSTLGQTNLTGGVELALTPRGRAIGQYVWIPAAAVPYVGGGVGLLRYAFEQVGDFVDYTDLNIFSEAYTSGGWTPSAHVTGGVDVRLTRRLAVGVEARYVWAGATVGDSFAGIGDVDLTGLRVSAGIQFSF